MKKQSNKSLAAPSNLGMGLSFTLLAGFAVIAMALPVKTAPIPPKSTGGVQEGDRGAAVAWPWTFDGGDPTSQKTAISSVDEIMRKAGYASIQGHVARAAWDSSGLQPPTYGNLPSEATLEAFGHAVHASKIYYGSVSWHTRSIWVDLGPKTISTATVNAYVFDVNADKVVYRSKEVAGRSDERENDYKIAADILITPLVTVVSGGPATPREQRAVQIALGRAYHSWVKPGSTK